MAKAKRMSDILASSAENDTSAAPKTATPPYSSEGPTLPLIEGECEHTAIPNTKRPKALVSKMDGDAEKESKPQKQAQPVATTHPALDEPWILLPPNLTKKLKVQTRLRGMQNVVPVVFTKNQNVKAGINRLKTYLGAYMNRSNRIVTPDALKQTDVLIAVSAQGEATNKLVTIVDMAKRVVAPSTTEKDGTIETWWMYTSLASAEVERKSRAVPDTNSNLGLGEKTKETQEEAFEPMEVDAPDEEEEQDRTKTRKVPVLTVWMTKKRLPAFKEAFGEQSFAVQTLPREED